MKIWVVEFEMNDFGQNVSHVVKKTYYTHRFFTDRQVYVGMTRSFLHSMDQQKWQYEPTPVTPAFPMDIRVAKFWFSTVNAELSKHKADGLKYLGEGNQEYILPGSRFRFVSLIKPRTDVLFIGKKGAMATIVRKTELSAKKVGPGITSQDILYRKEMEAWDIPEIHLTDMSARFVVGRFEAPSRIAVEYDGEYLSYFSLTRWRSADAASC